MANSYKFGKWSGTLRADLVGDASKTTPTLGEDYDTELKNLKKAKSNINTTIKAIKKQVNALKNHEETGKMATSYLDTTLKRLDTLEKALTSSVNSLENAVTKAQKEEWTRYKKILDEWVVQQKQS